MNTVGIIFLLLFAFSFIGGVVWYFTTLPECKSNSDCKSDELCEGNLCVKVKRGNKKLHGDCKKDKDCKKGLLCIDKKCAECGEDSDCKDKKKCRYRQCIGNYTERCRDVDGFKCYDDRTLDTTCVDKSCTYEDIKHSLDVTSVEDCEDKDGCLAVLCDRNNCTGYDFNTMTNSISLNNTTYIKI